MSDFLKPVSTVERRPTDPNNVRYVRSYLILRVAVGVLGVALPFILMFGDGLWFDGDPFPRRALSAYYYSGMRDVLVGALCSTGIFLVAYKVAERNLDNTLSIVAGIAVLAVALFPPRLPANIPPSPLQERLGETVTATVHFIAAAVFIIALAVLSYFFGEREGARKRRVGKRSPTFWRIYHWMCAALIVAALLWMGFTELTGWGPSESLLYGQVVSLVAFGASWLWKGLEIDMLRGTPAPALAETVRSVASAPTHTRRG